MKLSTVFPLVSVFALSMVACGKSESPGGSRPQAAAPAPAAPPAPAPAAPQRDALTAQDVERWQRGLAAEKKAVQEAGARLAAAKDENAKLEALHGTTEMATNEIGAKAAGVDVDTYRRIGQVLSMAAAQFSPVELEMDVSQAPPELIDQLKQAKAAGMERVSKQLPPDVIEAIRPRAAELRRADMELAGERLKIATGGR